MKDKQPEVETELDDLRTLDPQVISDIHKRYFPGLYRYARYRLGDETLAEDIAGETLVRLLESVYSGRGPHTNLRAWLMATASNLVNDQLRQEYSHPTETLPDGLNLHRNGLTPSQNFQRSETARAVRQALEKLTQEQQQVISLRFGSGYSLEETAMLMDKKPNAIKALQFRAIAALRRAMAEEVV